MIEVEKYQAKAAAAADALRAALLAVEECGADEALTEIVMHLGDDRTKLCRLFDLPPEQAFQVKWLDAQMDPGDSIAFLLYQQDVRAQGGWEGDVLPKHWRTLLADIERDAYRQRAAEIIRHVEDHRGS